MFFCNQCSNESENNSQIIIRDPLDISKSQFVNKSDRNTLMSVMTEKMVRYHAIIPSKFEQYLKQCRKNRSQFTDNQFYPNQKSLNYSFNNRKIIWKRITQIIPNVKIVDGFIEAADIQQGNVGDCYFLASVSSIAQVKQRIQKIFCNQMQVRPQGIYRMQVACGGQYKQIVIDDYIPVFQGSNRPVFCKPQGNQAWVLLLQKVWAKLKGSYGNISSGYPHQIFNTFMVAPCFYYQIPNLMVKNMFQKLFIWSKLCEATQKMYPICAGSRKAYTCQGIKPSHTYSILGAYQIPTANNQRVNILKIRNPWGDCQYQGRYSQYDDAFWTRVDPMLKLAIFKRKDANDGIFTIQFNEFLTNFQCLDICNEQPDYNYNFQKINARSNKPIYFQIQIDKVKEPTFYISIQKDFDRMSCFRNRQIEYGYCRILLTRKRQIQIEGRRSFNYQFVNSVLQTNFPDASMEVSSLQPGTYIVMTQTQFVNKSQGDLTVSLYSKAAMSMKHIQLPDPLFLHKVFTHHVYSFVPAQNRNYISKESIEDWTVSSFLLREGGYGYIFVYLGPDSKQKVQITCNIQKIYQSGFLVLQNQVKTQSGRLQFVLERNQEAIILLQIDLKRNFRQITFPPKGIRISRII